MGRGAKVTGVHSDGEVHEPPHYIRVRSGWMERLQLVVVVVQIMLLLQLIVYGSQPAQDARDTSLTNNALLCRIIFNQAPDRYDTYVEAGHCPRRIPDNGPQP